MKKYVIGDIHGNYLALNELLNKINFDYENDLLICLGDIVDGWPQTFECIELLLKIKNLIKIKGNHDEWFEKYAHIVLSENYDLNDLNDLNIYSWLFHGGKATVDSYINNNNIYKFERHKEFISSSLNYYIDDNNNLFIHAGYNDNNIPIKNKNKYDYSYLWDRQYVILKIINTYHIKEFNGDKNFNNVFIGHTPTISFENNKHIKDTSKPIINKNIYLVDTGIAFTGYLSCINLDTFEIYQSNKTGWEYYPDFKGRNEYTYNEFIKLNNC